MGGVRNLMLLVLVLFLRDVQDGAAATEKGSTKFHDLDVDSKLKILNKPLLKTFEIGDGQLFECVYIHEQPAFDHPSLRNHIIQNSPSSLPYNSINIQNEAKSRELLDVYPIPIECPLGFVPITRTKRQNIGRNSIFTKFNLNDLWNTSKQIEQSETKSEIALRRTCMGTYYGGKSSISVFNIDGLQSEQESGNIIGVTVKDEINYIITGSIVSKREYHDNRARLFILYKIASGECYNFECPGFVQTSRSIALGLPFANVSVYSGKQYSITILVLKDANTHNWWLLFGKDLTPVGYWPAELFDKLDVAEAIVTGGIVYGSKGQVCPPMGSGHYADEGFGKAAFARNFLIVDGTNTLVKPSIECLRDEASRPDYYDLSNVHNDEGELGINFYFGGPGGCKI